MKHLFSFLFLLLIGCQTNYTPVAPQVVPVTKSDIDCSVEVINPKLGGIGSGIIIAQSGNDLYVVTARHVITGVAPMLAIPPSKVLVSLPYRCGVFVDMQVPVVADVIALSDVDLDLALLKMKAHGAVAHLGNHLSRIGSEVSICGYPYGHGLFTTEGRISRYDVSDGVVEVFTTGAALPGNSGGGIFCNGECVGMIQELLFHTNDYSMGVSSIEIINWVRVVSPGVL